MNIKMPNKDVVEEFQKSEYWRHRLKFYEAFGFTEEAFDDESPFVREEAYKILGFHKKALNDKNDIIRLEAYKHFGFNEKAFNDENPMIRFQSFLALGRPEKIFEDKNPIVRFAGYNELGFSENSLFEKDEKIRRGAIEYFERCKEILNLDDAKYQFSEDEKELLRINGVAVFDESILKTS